MFSDIHVCHLAYVYKMHHILLFCCLVCAATLWGRRELFSCTVDFGFHCKVCFGCISAITPTSARVRSMVLSLILSSVWFLFVVLTQNFEYLVSYLSKGCLLDTSLFIAHEDAILAVCRWALATVCKQCCHSCAYFFLCALFQACATYLFNWILLSLLIYVIFIFIHESPMHLCTWKIFFVTLYSQCKIV